MSAPFGRLATTALALLCGASSTGFAQVSAPRQSARDTVHSAQPRAAATPDTARPAPAHGRGLFGKMAANAQKAAAAAQLRTGISGTDALQAAQTAALVAAKANPGVMMIQQMSRMSAQAEASSAAAAAASQANGAARMSVALQITALRQQALEQMGSGGSAADARSPAGMDPQLQVQYAQIVARAMNGDQTAVSQLTQLQREMAAAALRMQGAPVAQRQTFYMNALRDAITCATTAHGCQARAATP